MILLDEPTTGLDSRTANDVVELLSVLAHGRAICCTIHSPTSRAFSRFSELILLKEGRNIYSGPTSDVVSYFNSHGCTHPDDGSSIVEWIVDLTAPNSPSDLDFAAVYNSSMRDSYQSRLEALITHHTHELQLSDEHRKPSCLHSVYVLLKFRAAANYKTPQFLGPRFGEKIFLASLMLLICRHCGYES